MIANYMRPSLYILRAKRERTELVAGICWYLGVDKSTHSIYTDYTERMDETKGSVHAGTPASNFRFDESPAEDVKLIHFHNFEKLSTAEGVAIDSPEFLCAGNS
jgi:hypothetical protein